MLPETVSTHAGVCAPAYPTYPKPEWFVEAFDADVLNAWLATPRAPHKLGAMAIELRLPFHGEPECGCGNSDCKKDGACVEHLVEEMALYQAILGAPPQVCDLSWSSACAALPPKTLKRMHRAVLDHFGSPGATGFTVSIDPLAHHRDALLALRELGASSVHIGAELAGTLDPHTAAQFAQRTAALVAAARDAGFSSIEARYLRNACTPRGASALPTLDALLAAGPTRILLSDADACGDCCLNPPGTSAPAEFIDAAVHLGSAGYACIAQNLFALPTDAYAIAHRQGRLSCRSSGYGERPVGTALGLGPGAIGQVGPFYYQNHRSPARYRAALNAGRLPIERGLHLSHDDLVRRAIIASLATNLFVDIPAIEAGYSIDFTRTFAPELRQLQVYEKAGLLTLDAFGITLTPPGRLACRAICRVFDVRVRQLIERTPQGTLL